MTAQQLFSNYSIDQIRAGFIRYFSSQRNEDKYGLAYLLHMINHDRYMGAHLFPEDFKRAELLQSLKDEVQDEKNLRKCIQSDTIANRVLDIVEDALVS